MRLAVFTTVYQKAAAYIADFVTSLSEQTDRDFNLYVCNDGLLNAKDYFTPFTNRLHIIPANGSICRIRKDGIRRLHGDGFDSVVFADCDDRFSANRVAIARKNLANSDVVVNELIPFGDQISNAQPLLGKFLHNGQSLTLTDVLDGNILGLSNTAARLNTLIPHLDSINDLLSAFDWALFTRALQQRCICVFTDVSTTFYRQHNDNIANIDTPTETTILRAVQIKSAHYTDLSALNPLFAERAKGFNHLRQELEKSPAYLAAYTDSITKSPLPVGLWWHTARLPKESVHEALQ